MWHKGLLDGTYTPHSHLLDKNYLQAGKILIKSYTISPHILKPYAIYLHITEIFVGDFLHY